MKKSMKKLLSLGMAVALAASLTACGGGKTSETTTAAESNAASGETTEAAKASGEGSFKIGGIGPITGGAAIYGQAVMRGAELAIDEINAGGGIGGAQIEYNFQDDEHDTEKAVNAYNTLKDWGMQMLVGTVTSAPCIAVGAESSNDNMFQLTPSGSAVDCAKFDNQFRVCFSDPNQGAASAQYIGETSWLPRLPLFMTAPMFIHPVSMINSFPKQLIRELKLCLMRHLPQITIPTSPYSFRRLRIQALSLYSFQFTIPRLP